MLSNLSRKDSGEKDASKGQKVLMTELMNYILRPAKVKKSQPNERQEDLQKAYTDLFLR